MKTKKQLAKDLSDFLLIRNISWEKLPKQDLVRLHEAFMRLKKDINEMLGLLEVASQPPEETHYIV